MNLRSILLIATVSIIGCNSSSKNSTTIGAPENEVPSTTIPVIAHSLIPTPSHIEINSTSLFIDSSLALNFDTSNSELQKTVHTFKTSVNSIFNVDFSETGTPLNITLSNDLTIKPEGYELSINETSIELSASYISGIHYGLKTIEQMLYLYTDNSGFSIPSLTINDSPRFAYRGAMLDVARHFFTVEDVFSFIDLISYYKLNKLHLHLSDDQGWRIEIKSWPQLTSIGGSTEVGGGNGGYYTQEEFVQIVTYASERFIEVIPEIDMPGHSNAALASYEELNCDKSAPALYTGIEVGFSSLCIRDEVTYEFIDDVISELASLSPSNYIHIGGDESLNTSHEDYIYFIERVNSIVNSYEKVMIGWEEVAQLQLAPHSIVQFWSNEIHLEEAIEQNSELILSPAPKAYLDMKYHNGTTLGLSWAGFIEVDTAYQWDPSDYVSTNKENLIKGIEAPLWTETVENIDQLEFMVLPRLPGHAEIAWSSKGNRVWSEYRLRLANHKNYFEKNNRNFYPSSTIPWED